LLCCKSQVPDEPSLAVSNCQCTAHCMFLEHAQYMQLLLVATIAAMHRQRCIGTIYLCRLPA
jgi:hypothetical protein